MKSAYEQAAMTAGGEGECSLAGLARLEREFAAAVEGLGEGYEGPEVRVSWVLGMVCREVGG